MKAASDYIEGIFAMFEEWCDEQEIEPDFDKEKLSQLIEEEMKDYAVDVAQETLIAASGKTDEHNLKLHYKEARDWGDKKYEFNNAYLSSVPAIEKAFAAAREGYVRSDSIIDTEIKTP